MQNLLKQETVELHKLYDAMAKDGIEVCEFELPASRAVSVMDDGGRCFIGLDNTERRTEAEERTMLLHELGHCKTGAFYNASSPFSVVGKCEKKADEWAILTFLPLGKFKNAYESGARTGFELAEYFGVSEQFIAKAIEYYLQRGERIGTY